MKYLVLIIAISLNLNNVIAQDSNYVLDLNNYLDLILKSHPIAQNADLSIELADAKLLKSKGNFDPKLDLGIDQKYFDGKDYYSNSVAQINVPIWYGPKIKAGYELNDGTFLNDQNTVPDQGLAFLGLSLPLGRGLFYDSRRYEQQSAEIFQNAASFEKQKILADLFFRARVRYFEWQGDFRTIQVLNQISGLAAKRFDFVKQSYSAGDLPAIDTLESFVQYKNRIIDANKQIAKYKNKIAKLSALISFDPDFQTIISNLSPINNFNLPDTINLKELIVNINEQNPEIRLLLADLNSSNLNQRLAKENLKPNLELSYNILNNGNDYYALGTYSENNYKWNLDFQFPIFLRKERGELQKTSVKIKQTENKLAEKKAEIQFKLNGILNQISDLLPVLDEFQALSLNYRQLLDSEFIKYQVGDSSLFKVNTRENKLIEIEVKRIELQIEVNKLEAEFFNIAGITGI
ncbi:TolC family protein [Candidatus Kapabacteria bacterium]|nr:TolC family protein [Candidatus Kapabacteria bacterium]